MNSLVDIVQTFIFSILLLYQKFFSLSNFILANFTYLLL
nr:MAG TPA: hypothetical protein [Caudoviricetes sp.]